MLVTASREGRWSRPPDIDLRNESGVSSTATPDRDSVARRTYQRYEARGRSDGLDQEDWYEAERELRTERTAVTTTPVDGEAHDGARRSA
jgi:hypothetical protein